eukprot:Pgem_evm1s15880
MSLLTLAFIVKQIMLVALNENLNDLLGNVMDANGAEKREIDFVWKLFCVINVDCGKKTEKE